MGYEDHVKASSPEATEPAHLGAAGAAAQTLGKLQESAGLLDKIGGKPVGSDASSEAILGGNAAEGAGKGLGEIIKALGNQTPPSDKERGEAEKTLEGRMSKLIPEADRAAMKEMTTALTNGDAKAFSEALKKASGDPEKLKALVAEVDKMLEEKGSGTRLDVTADGHVLVSDAARGTGLSFDPKSGRVEAKAVEQNMDGSVLVKPGELLHVKTDDTFKEMGDKAVNAVNGKLDFGVERPDPGPIFKPGWPRDPEEPHFPRFPRGDDPIIKNPGWPHDPGFDITPKHPHVIDPGFDITPKNPHVIDPGFDLTPRSHEPLGPGSVPGLEELRKKLDNGPESIKRLQDIGGAGAKIGADSVGKDGKLEEK